MAVDALQTDVQLLCIKFLFLLVIVVVQITSSDSKDLTLEPGHLKPFGQGRPSYPIEEMDTFPSPEYFFENYVKTLKPLKIKGGATLSKAFEKWTDDYFMAQNEPSDHFISVETVKKESRQQKVISMHFKDFVKIYNNSENYMVNAVPIFLRHDITIPCSLQCEQLINDNFVDNIMWFSSGGTKSVVHTDSVDNMNCLFRGKKHLVMVDPALYRDKVDFDHPEGAYSEMDIDSVDYLKYPGMAEVEFYHVNLTAGDCLYIPYLWIHQVTSFGSNLAVNIWWRHHLTEELDFSKCNNVCDPAVTLEDAMFGGFAGLTESPLEIRKHFLNIISKAEEVSFENFVKVSIGLVDMDIVSQQQIQEDLMGLFSLLDQNKDGVLSKSDIEQVSDETLLEVSELLQILEENFEDAYNDMAVNKDKYDNRSEHEIDVNERDQHEEL